MEQFLYIILIPKISKNLCHRYYFFPSLYRNNLSIDISNNSLSPHNSNTARKKAHLEKNTSRILEEILRSSKESFTPAARVQSKEQKFTERVPRWRRA